MFAARHNVGNQNVCTAPSVNDICRRHDSLGVAVGYRAVHIHMAFHYRRNQYLRLDAAACAATDCADVAGYHRLQCCSTRYMRR